ncbi:MULTISPECIES: DUF4876 domain-containing protein [Chryseobacterium]|uniref:DUF4876 domain-containing protein n=1 Tax=Chryseobacterium geocarposphaerae TaxID=1416776 RepID=A0ABU1LC15_9FLAO|nr:MULTISPECIES: DUF4876 domain-containing protein [Chryseobacterium]MDR6404277.1 hypothetical protein [Chryseobacterium geocarposphaerae]MDR6699255.1 hypothetical protein [Chryseobacterium ginsenosidimutans]
MKQLLSFLTIMLLLISCRDDDFGSNNNSLQPTNFRVEVKYDATYGSLHAKNATVVLTNNNSSDTYTQSTDANGFANFTNVIPGTYKVTVFKKMLSDEFNTTFGYAPTVSEISFNGVQENATINVNVQSTFIELKGARIGDLLIKQIYYAGSHATQGASFRDQFIEIYNNSNEVIYADGLYIGQLYGKVNTNTTNNNYSQPNGQFDWSKSIGMTMGSTANTDYVYADYVLKIPGNGTQYPIFPGQSIVIAANGVNHKAPLVDNTGTPITVQNPSLTVDLSTADFEVYLGDFNLSIGEPVYKYDIQNPAVKDMQIAYWGRQGYWSPNNDFLIDNPGRDSFVIFRINDFDTLPNYSDPSVTSISSSTRFFKQIPNSAIIDGVDLQHFNPNSQRPKMLSAAVDASSISCDASFNSQAVIRKTKTEVTMSNGTKRKILEDSNNSANDFVKQAANPRGFQQ